MDVTGKVALVTGGASGIGKAMIEILLQKKAKGIMLVDIDESGSLRVQEELQKKYGDGKIHVCKCDVSSFEEMEACFKKVKSIYGDLHIVCNNAGIFNEVIWQRMLEININGVVNGTKLAIKHMNGQSSGGGVIINTASVAALSLAPFATLYATSKYAIVGFTRGVATFDPEVINKKIRVNALCPPAVDTPMVQHGIVIESPYQKGFDTLAEIFSSIQPHELAEQFIKLIEEPHHGQAMYVPDAQNTDMIPDETKAFREKNKIDAVFMDGVKPFINSL